MSLYRGSKRYCPLCDRCIQVHCFLYQSPLSSGGRNCFTRRTLSQRRQHCLYTCYVADESAPLSCLSPVLVLRATGSSTLPVLYTCDSTFCLQTVQLLVAMKDDEDRRTSRYKSSMKEPTYPIFNPIIHQSQLQQIQLQQRMRELEEQQNARRPSVTTKRKTRDFCSPSSSSDSSVRW